MGNWIGKEAAENDDNGNLSPKDSKKVVVAGFDPRSPSNGIVRTPIFYMSNSNEKGSKQNIFFNVNDPRSPSEQYNRTPINIRESKYDNSFDQNSFDMNADASTASDSSFLLQHVPEDNDKQQKQDSTGSPDRYTISSKTLTNFSSNLPRHIIQRKQIEKINKKKFQNLDKENYE